MTKKTDLKVKENDQIEEEKKSSYDVDASIPDPVKKDAKEPKAKGGKTPNAPKTKAGAISEMVRKMSSMETEELMKQYEVIMGESVELDEEAEDDIELKIKAADLDISEDLDALFGEDDLTEEFKETARTIFESAVVANVNKKVEELAAVLETDYDTTISEAVERIEADVNKYLDYVVSEWVEENKLAIDTNIRHEMSESMLKGLHDLFTEHYVDIPESKVDLVGELLDKVDSLEASLSEEVEKNVSLSEEVKSYQQNKIFNSVCEGLTDTQVSRLEDLSEGIEFGPDYEKKINLLKDRYFNLNENKKSGAPVLDDSDNPTLIEEEVKELNEDVDPTVGHIAAYISRTSSKRY